jgi:cyclohexyl-isocyanide hydratase
MKISFLIFPEATQLDITGPLEVLSRGPEVECCLVSKRVGLVSMGVLTLDIELGLEEIPDSDLLVVPGGPGVIDAMRDREILKAIGNFNDAGRHILSVCTGALLLGAAGILEGRSVATHWASREFMKKFGAKDAPDRVYTDGNITSSAGVSAGIDGAFALADRLWGRDLTEEILVQMQYQPSEAFSIPSPRIGELQQSLRDGKLKTLIEKRRNLIESM